MSNIFNRFDDKVISAGFLTLIKNPSYYRSFQRYLIKDYIYQGDNSPQAEATRDLIDVLAGMTKGKDLSVLNINSVKGEIAARIENDKRRENTLSHYERWTGDNELRELALNEGTFNTFLNYLKVLQIAKLSTEMIGDFNKFNIEGAVEKMSASLTNINSINIGADMEELDADMLEQLAERQVDYASSNSIQTGCDGLDNDIGGFRPKTLNVFLGLTGNGKTTMCHHLIRMCIQQKKKAMVFCVEDSKESFASKVLACLTGIDKKRIEKGEYKSDPEEVDKIQKAERDLKQYIRVFFVYGKSIEYIHEKTVELEQLERMEGKSADRPVHIVDYTGHIYNQSGGKGEKDYIEISNAYKKRRDFAAKYNKICFDFMQVNREGAKKLTNMKDQVLTLSEIAKGFDLTHVCDNIISINRDANDVRDRKCKLHVCKARDGVAGNTYHVKTEFEKARFNMVGSTPIGVISF